MRINIKTSGKKIKEPDIRAMYVLSEGIKMSSNRMLRANLKFILSDRDVLEKIPEIKHVLNCL